jgi:hypothetical protein
MTTKKHKVSAYLSDSEFEILKGLATQNQVSQSQIVILAIRELSKLGQVELPVSYLPSEVNGVIGEDIELLIQNKVNTAITELKTFVADTSPKLETMETVIASLVTQDQLTTKLNELLETVTGNVEPTSEIMPSQDSPVKSETDIQDVSPINQVKEPEMMIKPYIADLAVDQELDCPFEVGRTYTQTEMKELFNAKHSSDIINWVDDKRGAKSYNPIAKKYSHYFTFKSEGTGRKKRKLYTFNGLPKK